jgi:hypothetical protein
MVSGHVHCENTAALTGCSYLIQKGLQEAHSISAARSQFFISHIADRIFN